MTQKFFKIDGKNYNIAVTDLKRSAAVLDGENAGRVKSGAMVRDIIGTYYNYSMTLDTSSISPSDYDELYNTVTAPVDSHNVTLPFGQSIISFKAYVSGAEDTLVKTKSATDDNEAIWQGLTVTFTAMKPQRTP